MSVVLDASAILVLILGEKGEDVVSQHMTGANVSTVNLCEVITKLVDYNLSPAAAWDQIERLDMDIRDFQIEQAQLAARLRPHTKSFGLSLGDRACMALGQSMKVPVLTSDQRMKDAGDMVNIDVMLIR